MVHEMVKLTRDVEAIQIPYGQKVRLASGTRVTIEQELGGNYTVMTDHGLMVRIDGKDADAMGLSVKGPAAKVDLTSITKESVIQEIWNQMKTCYDPEIPVNIVDLGLIYECLVREIPEGGYRVDVKMTLTAPGCGMGPVLQSDVQAKLRSIPGITQAFCEVVFEPPWDKNMMTEAAKLQLGML